MIFIWSLSFDLFILTYIFQYFFTSFDIFSKLCKFITNLEIWLNFLEFLETNFSFQIIWFIINTLENCYLATLPAPKGETVDDNQTSLKNESTAAWPLSKHCLSEAAMYVNMAKFYCAATTCVRFVRRNITNKWPCIIGSETTCWHGIRRIMMTWHLIMFYWCVRWHGDDEVGDPPAWHTAIQMMCLTDGPFWLTIMVWPVQSNWVIGSVDSYVLAFVLSLCAYDIIWTCVMLPRSNAICEKKSVPFLARPWHVPRFLRWFLVQYFS